jgi:hypothetical protein
MGIRREAQAADRVARMRQLVPVPLLALVLAAALVPASALAVTRSDVVTATVHKTGTDGSRLVYKGTVKSRVFGRGTVVEKIGGLGTVGTFTIRYRRGTVRGSSVAHAKAAPGGGVTFTGTYRLLGGTGAYRHIRGSGTFSGKGPGNLMLATFKQRGRVTY